MQILTHENNHRLLVDIDKLTKQINILIPNLEIIKNYSDKELEDNIIKASRFKRLNEKCEGDPEFHQQLFVEVTNNEIDISNLNISLKETASLINEFIQKKSERGSFESDGEHKDFYHHIVSDCHNIADLSQNLQFQAWRRRQIARTSSQMYQSIYKKIPHMLGAFELSKGCSVGCWFCAVSAPTLNDIFAYNSQNRDLWRGVLSLFKTIHGKAAKAGFCYWASDPLDNPDYENFCLDFYELLGAFPQTTTALAMRNPERTRKLLKLSLERGCLINRFSVLSLGLLNKIHQELTPEELAFVKLELQYQKSYVTLSNSGRARDYYTKQKQKNQLKVDEKSLPGTIACVSGFLFNMVDRTVKLISPYNADDRWPLGYRIFEEGTFENVDDLKVLLEGMIARHMPLEIQPNDKIKFREDLEYESLSNGFKLFTRFKTYRFTSTPYAKYLGEIIYKDNKTAREIADYFRWQSIPSSYIYKDLNSMFELGLLAD